MAEAPRGRLPGRGRLRSWLGNVGCTRAGSGGDLLLLACGCPAATFPGEQLSLSPSLGVLSPHLAAEGQLGTLLGSFCWRLPEASLDRAPGSLQW